MASLKRIGGRTFVHGIDVTDLKDPDIKIDAETGLHCFTFPDGSEAMWSTDGLTSLCFSAETPQFMKDAALKMHKNRESGDFVQVAL